jgi:hypothetical protein
LLWLCLLSGELVPKAYHGVLHPVLVTAVVANAGLALQSKLLGISYAAAQKAYLAKVTPAAIHTLCCCEVAPLCSFVLTTVSLSDPCFLPRKETRHGPLRWSACW